MTTKTRHGKRRHPDECYLLEPKHQRAEFGRVGCFYLPNSVGVRRMKKLIKFLRQLPPDLFDYGEIASSKDKPAAFGFNEPDYVDMMREALIEKDLKHCGSIGCAIGWSLALFQPRVVSQRKVLGCPDPYTYKITGCDGSRQEVDYVSFSTTGSVLFDIYISASAELFSAVNLHDGGVYKDMYEGNEKDLDIEVFSDKATPKAVAYRLEEFLRTGCVLLAVEKGFKIP